MDTHNFNVFLPDDDLKNICCKLSSITSDSEINSDAMAPSTNLMCSSPLNIHSNELQISSFNYTEINDQPVSPLFNVKCLTEDINTRFLKLSARHRFAEKRAARILVRLNSLMAPNTPDLIKETGSEKTESSSEDDDIESNNQSKIWFKTRATIKSHWSFLKTEMVRAMDCLQNLKPLHHRCKKLRKSLPLLSQRSCADTITENFPSRTLSFEKSDIPRHSYYDLSSLSGVDFQFPGNATPFFVDQPQCKQRLGNKCILCSPIFCKKSNHTPSFNTHHNTSDIALRSIHLDISDDDSFHETVHTEIPKFNTQTSLLNTKHSGSFSPMAINKTRSSSSSTSLSSSEIDTTNKLTNNFFRKIKSKNEVSRIKETFRHQKRSPSFQSPVNGLYPGAASFLS